MARAEPPKKPAEKEPDGDEKDVRQPQADSAKPPASASAHDPLPEKEKPPAPANENKPAPQKTEAEKTPAPASENKPANENAPQKAETGKPQEKAAETPAAQEAEAPKPAEAEKKDAEGDRKGGLKQKIADWVKEQFADKEGEKKRPMKIKIFEKGVDAAGFGDILRAWRSPENRVRNVLKSIGSKAADMVAGRIVSMTFRMIAVTWVAGIIGGVSTFGGLALLALATGAASSLYTYGKEYLHDKLYGPKEKRKDVKLFDKGRLLNAGIAFGTGTLMGALGAWLAKTGILQNLFTKIGDALFGGIEAGKGAVTEAFNMSAAPPEKAMPLAVPPVSNAFAATIHPAVMPESAVPASAAPARAPRPGLAFG